MRALGNAKNRRFEYASFSDEQVDVSKKASRSPQRGKIIRGIRISKIVSHWNTIADIGCIFLRCDLKISFCRSLDGRGPCGVSG
jgi:hypothetical protein